MGGAVKRDMDLVRALLLAIQNRPADQNVLAHIEGYSEDQIDEHLYLLEQAGLIELLGTGTLQNFNGLQRVSRLTWEGHEYCEAFRDEGRWQETKRLMGKTGGFVLEVAKQIAVDLLRKQLLP